MRVFLLFLSVMVLTGMGGEETPNAASDRTNEFVANHPFTYHIVNLWKKGESGFLEVRGISRQRLNRNPNDVVGLMLQLQYEMEYIELDTIMDTCGKLAEATKEIRTPNFSRVYNQMEKQCKYIEWMNKNIYSDNTNILEDKAKAGLPKEMYLSPIGLLELEEDGLVSMDDLEEKKLPNTAEY